MDTWKKKKVRLSPLHLMAFVFVYLFDILLFLAFRGYFFFIVILVFTLLVPLSFYMTWRLVDYISENVATEKQTIRLGEENEILFSIINQSWLCALRGTWFLDVGNSFYQTSDRQKLLLSIPPRGKRQYRMNVTVTNLGQFLLTCKEFFVTDFLGIFTVRADCSAENSFFVLPPQDGSSQLKLPDTYFGAADFSESPKRGNDYSEVSDIRTYMPGDRPRDIHWKLSARQPELMVKERISLSGNEHILLLALPGGKEQAEKILAESYYAIKGLMDRHIAVRLLIWNNPHSFFESYLCTCQAELDAAFCEIFHTDLLSHSSDLLPQYMKNCYPQLENYLCVTSKDNSVQLEMCVNG